ncbi:MAG: response regulator transcription factor [Anaerolineales bacterium]|nr:response regulator transcription factor [Anaerolineales bacterium]
MRRPRILIVDDDLVIIKFLRANLKASDYDTLTAMDGAEALEVIERELPDLVILDIMMPNMDGFEVCRQLREWSRLPVIMLSARGDVTDKVKCLNLGADDYITKPFGVAELTARVRSMLRRTKAAAISTPPSFTSGDLKINFAQRQVTIAGNEVKLTPTEYRLLEEFVVNAGKVLTHKYLLNKVWGPEYGEEKEYLRVFIARLRTKLEADPKNPRYIITVPGVGYQLGAIA